MERFFIGTCRSGKTVTSEPESDGLDSNEEIFDALAMLERLAIREIRKYGESDLFVSVYCTHLFAPPFFHDVLVGDV